MSSSPCYTHSSAGYRKWSLYVDGKKTTVYVHRLLAVAEHGFDALEGCVVHHKNGCPFDNRPENIEPMSQSEHAALHSSDAPRTKGGEFGTGQAGSVSGGENDSDREETSESDESEDSESIWAWMNEIDESGGSGQDQKALF